MPTRPVILANGTALAPIGTATESTYRIGESVALSLQSTAGYTSFAWAIVGKPAGSAVALGSLTGYTSTIAADVAGEYVIKGTATGADGTSSARVSVVIVRSRARGIRKVGTRRSADVAQDVDDLKTRLDALVDITDAINNDPRSYGATGGDATHNDGPGIQAAITAAAASNDGTVTFSPGTYYLTAPHSAPITVPSNVRIVGNGARLVVSAVAGQSCIGLTLSGASNVEISGLTIEGVLGGAVPSAGYGISITNSTGIRLLDMELLYHWYDGILIAGTSNRIRQTRIYAHHNRRSNESVIGGSRLVFRDCVFSNAGYAASPEGVECGLNIECDGDVSIVVDDVQFDNCDFRSNGSAGSGLGVGLISRKGVGGSRPTNIRVRSSRIYDNQIAGVVVDLCDGVTFSECYATGQDGAVVAGAGQYAFGITDCTNVQILGNRGENNSRFIVAAGCDGIVVANNHARGRASSVMGDDYNGIEIRNQGAPTLASNRSVRVASNTVIGFGGVGIAVSHASSAEIANNTTRDNGQNGIAISGAPNALVSKNTTTGNGRQAAATYSDIKIGAGCDQASVLDNVCRYHDKYTAGTVRAPFNLDYVILAATAGDNLVADWFVGAPLELTGGTGANQRQTINSFNNTTKRADINQIVTLPDATTTYAIRWQHIVASSIRVDAGSTGVRVLGNDVRDSAAISDAGTSTVSTQTLGAAATDPASTMALANNLRTALINLNLGTT